MLYDLMSLKQQNVCRRDARKQKTLKIIKINSVFMYLGRDLNPYILADTGF